MTVEDLRLFIFWMISSLMFAIAEIFLRRVSESEAIELELTEVVHNLHDKL